MAITRSMILTTLLALSSSFLLGWGAIASAHGYATFSGEQKA
jgi:hypothetical protein